MKDLCLFGALAGLALASSSSAVAQQADSSEEHSDPFGTQDQLTDADQSSSPTGEPASYTASDFSRFSPNNAYEMVTNIPGFRIDEAENRRGLGQGGANVLIDGQRIATKSDDAEAVLRRIAASSVERIDVVDAATLAIPGLSGQVANVITSGQDLTVNYAWEPEIPFSMTVPRLYAGQVSASGKTGLLEYAVSVSNTALSFRDAERGFEDVRSADGTLLEFREESAEYSGDRPKFAANLTFDPAGPVIANFNASYEFYNRSIAEESRRLPVMRAPSVRSLLSLVALDEYEVGGDISFPLAGGVLKLIGLYGTKDFPTLTTLLTRVDDSTETGRRFFREEDSSEWIARAEYGWTGSGNWQIALEGALNRLATDSTLEILDDDGNFVPIPFPGSSAVVDEQRAEASLSHNRKLSENLDFQASLGGEYSRLRQVGAGGQIRSFWRPKGFVALAWEASPSLNLRARVEREVGQLDFGDFVASVNLQEEEGEAANPDLVPPQTFRMELEATKALAQMGSITLLFFRDAISDIIGLVPVGPLTEVTGNIDKATRVGAEPNGTLRFESLGWKGAQLEVELALARTSLTDPLLGVDRPISEDRTFFFDGELRQDFPGTQIAAGAGLRAFAQSNDYRIDSEAAFSESPPYTTLFVEHKNLGGMRVRATLSNLLNTTRSFDRTTFASTRGGSIDFIESRERTFPRSVILSISGTF